jgi:hypothetical protein
MASDDIIMTPIKITPRSFVLELSREELEILNNALNEVCNGIDLVEFETRIGCSREYLQALLSQVNRALSTGREK